MSNISSNITKTTDEAVQTVKVAFNNELNEATSQIWNTLGSSYVINDGNYSPLKNQSVL